jgi:hypothetical protein
MAFDLIDKLEASRRVSFFFKFTLGLFSNNNTNQKETLPTMFESFEKGSLLFKVFSNFDSFEFKGRSFSLRC